MKTRIGLFGGHGKMGQEIQQAISQSRNLKLEFIVGSDLKISKKKCDVVIDFSTPHGLGAAINYCLSHKVPLVSGTTGITSKDKKNIGLASKRIPLIWAPNMSVGVAVLRKSLEALKTLKNYSFYIEEWHHQHKKDRPSGTALSLAEKLESVIEKQNLEIHSVRAGGIFGIHKVFAIGQSEYLEFSHHALNRKVFAEGAVMIADWIQNKKPGLYQVESYLDDVLS